MNQAQSEYKHSLTFRVRRCAVMCIDCQYALCYVVIATKPVHQLQICAMHS